MRNSFVFGIIKSDLIMGFASNKIKYIIVALFFGCRIFCITEIFLDFAEDGLIKSPSVTDIWFNIFEGIPIYIPNNNLPFQIPFVWLMIQILVAFLIFNYPTQDLCSYGTQILIHIKNRKMWWISKCIWNICTVLFFYCILFVISIYFSAMYGNFNFELNVSVNNEINGIELNINNNTAALFAIYGLPVIASIAASLMQMMLSFVLSPIYSFIITIGYYVISAYYCSPFLIGNYSMMLRSASLNNGSIESLFAVAICSILCIASIIIGIAHIDKIDIVRKDGR